jgi:hypothetical protein
LKLVALQALLMIGRMEENRDRLRFTPPAIARAPGPCGAAAGTENGLTLIDALGFLAKLIGTTARIGGAVALAALALFILRRSGVEPFTTLDPAVYSITIVAGIIGGCVVIVELFVVFGKWSGAKIQAHLNNSADFKMKRDTAIKNMQTLLDEYLMILLFLKRNNWKRFPAPRDNELLFLMRNAFLLEIDDPNYSFYSITTYYVVPDYVWERIDALAVGRVTPQNPPWNERV